VAAIFLFFSFSTGKRGVYIIPLYPAAALLVARLFTRADGGRGPAGGRDEARVRLRRAVFALALIAVPAGAAAAILVPRRHPDLREAALLAGLLIAAGGIAASWLAARGRAMAAAGALAAAMSGLMLVGVEMVFPRVNRYLNLRGFAEGARAHYRPEIPIASTKEKREAWVFYGGRIVEPLDTPGEVLAWMSGEGPRDLLIDDEMHARIRTALPEGIIEVYAGMVSNRTCRLLRRPAPAGRAP
jgi:4-amino-4-deoxy-L-arabinose transferase-like glycosyltransferase